MWSEKKLHDLLTTPSSRLIDDLSRLDGDIMLLGAGGKMGPRKEGWIRKYMRSHASPTRT